MAAASTYEVLGPIETGGPFEEQTEPPVDLTDRLPKRYRDSLHTTQRIAEAVGSELIVRSVDAVDYIPPEPGVYLLREDDATRYGKILATKFTLEPEILSGKTDSAHAVLPGMLSIVHYEKGGYAEKHIPVAAKLYNKRELADRFNRVAAEVAGSQLQAAWGEIAFQPIAVAVAPPEYQGKGTDPADFNILLVTKLDTSVASLDNAPWPLGFEEDNIELANSASAALGRFNSMLGMHGDAKIKNIAQRPDGKTSMIDMETFQGMPWNDENLQGISTTVNEDFGTFLQSLAKAGFFSKEPFESKKVIDDLAQTYLEQWDHYSEKVQHFVAEQTFQVSESCVKAILGEA